MALPSPEDGMIRDGRRAAGRDSRGSFPKSDVPLPSPGNAGGEDA
jgi:hypothetical protein